MDLFVILSPFNAVGVPLSSLFVVFSLMLSVVDCVP